MTNQFQEEISLAEVTAIVLRSWRAVVVLPLVVAIGVGAWTFVQPRQYTATATFLSQGSEGRMAGNASMIAQQLGISLGGDRAGPSPQLYMDLLQSLAVLRTAVESEYQVLTRDGHLRRASLIELFESEERRSIPAWRIAVDELRESMSTSVSRETGIVRLTVTTSEPQLSEQVAQRLVDILNEFNLEVRQNRAQEEGRFIAARLDDARGELLDAEGALQAFLRQNREFRNSPELQFEHDRLQRQVAMRQEVYTSLLRSREELRIDAVRDIPVLSLIDPPAASAQPEGRGTILRTVVAFVLGLIIAVFVAVLGEMRRRGREGEAPQMRELEAAARQAWADLRRPQRWIRRGERRAAVADGSVPADPMAAIPPSE
jgi:uncharacterized protein involved in exopolysaccharide biosynthesis